MARALVSVVLLWLVNGGYTSNAQAQGQEFRATHYGTSYNGSPLGCAGYGTYSSSDTTILAVGYPYSLQWPCGAVLELEGPDGRSLTVIRQDTCPGCGSGLLDLSEAGITQVCGGLGGCTIRVIGVR